MARYIDTKYLGKCETCRHHSDSGCNIWCDAGEGYSPNMFKIPTADVVEVVRCEDCIHYKDKGVLNEFDKPLGVCKKDVYFWDDEPIEVLFDDFCSYGERKDA